MPRCAGCQAEVPQPRPGDPLPRLATCPACHAELHACRQCRFHDALARRCRNPHVDEAPKDPDRSNFCDWYEMGDPAAAAPGSTPEARKAFEDLLGG